MSSLNRVLALLAALALPLPSPALAAAPATVEAVQAPVWRDRGDITVPLTPGMELRSGDVLRTGPGARAYLMLAEGSRVKLGESGRFAFHSRSLRPERAFRGALDVLAGAFRYTTAGLNKAMSRNLVIRVGTATIGIRGTDLWGRTRPEGDMVALVEGRIEITRAGQTTEMTQAMTYFDAPRGQAAAVKELDPDYFRGLARETEILAGDGAARSSGAWRVLAGTVASEGEALELYDRIREAGFAARIRPVKGESQGWRYEILLRGFSSAAEAEAAAARLKTATSLKTTVLR